MSGTCTVERRTLITHSCLDLTTGEAWEGAKEWEVRPCNTPLFSEQERKAGVCRSCREGWTNPENYPTGKGLITIKGAI